MQLKKDIITVDLGLDHTHKCTTGHHIIGRAGEGRVTQYVIKVPKELCTCSLYIEFEKPNGEKFKTEQLQIEKTTSGEYSASYYIPPFILTDDGELKVQISLEMGNDESDKLVWKSNVKTYTIDKSVNAGGYIGVYLQPSGTAEITANGLHNVSPYESANVNVQPNLTELRAVYTCNSSVDGYTLETPEGYDGIERVHLRIEVALPVEVSHPVSLVNKLETAEVGSIYKYTGETSDPFESGALYIVEEVSE